jgi:NADPH-dependent ferric siderophore reductase
MISLQTSGGELVRRRYSIRRFDAGAGTLEINALATGNGPGASWARRAQPGDVLAEVVAPRGKITVDSSARWHLFAGDETAVPAMLRMTEALPPSVPVWQVFEVESELEEVTVSARLRSSVHWLHRRGRPVGRPSLLLPALAESPLPDGPGHAYLAGEAKVVLAMRDLLVARGIPRAWISAKAYWRADAANLDRGEPESIE